MNQKKKEKERIRLIPLGIIMSALFIFSFSFVNAAVLVEQPISNSFQYGVGANFIQELGTNLPIGTIEDISFRMNATTSSGLFNVTLGRCDAPFSGTTCTGTGGIAEQSINYAFPNNFNGVVTGSITATTTDPTKYYYISLGTSIAVDIGGTVNDVYTSGRCETNAGAACSVLADMFFRVGTLLPPTGSSGSVEIIYPPDGSAVPYFDQWVLNYNFNGSSPDITYIGVRYGTSTSNLNYNNVKPLPSFGTGSTTLGHVCFAGLNGTVCPHPIDDWYAQAYIREGFTDVATSSLISFSQITSENYEPTIEIEHATSTGSVFNQCEQMGVNNWQNAICNLFAFFFAPHQSSFTLITNVLNSFKQVFPFSIFFSINSSLQQAVSGGVSDLTFSIPLFHGIVDTEFVFLSPTIFEDYFGSNAKNVFFELQEKVLWVSVGFIMLAAVFF